MYVLRHIPCRKAFPRFCACSGTACVRTKMLVFWCGFLSGVGIVFNSTTWSCSAGRQTELLKNWVISPCFQQCEQVLLLSTGTISWWGFFGQIILDLKALTTGFIPWLLASCLWQELRSKWKKIHSGWVMKFFVHWQFSFLLQQFMAHVFLLNLWKQGLHDDIWITYLW